MARRLFGKAQVRSGLYARQREQRQQQPEAPDQRLRSAFTPSVMNRRARKSLIDRVIPAGASGQLPVL